MWVHREVSRLVALTTLPPTAHKRFYVGCVLIYHAWNKESSAMLDAALLLIGHIRNTDAAKSNVEYTISEYTICKAAMKYDC